jgi:hypothetical protein
MGVEGGLMFNPKSIAKKFDEFLDNNGLRFFGVVIGGAALVLLEGGCGSIRCMRKASRTLAEQRANGPCPLLVTGLER